MILPFPIIINIVRIPLAVTQTVIGIVVVRHSGGPSAWVTRVGCVDVTRAVIVSCGAGGGSIPTEESVHGADVTGYEADVGL